MFPCCNHCNTKYINEDDTIDSKLIEELEKTDLEKVETANQEVGMPMYVFKPITCKCPCHIKGSQMDH